MRKDYEDHIGRSFNKLTLVRLTDKFEPRIGVFRCDCGTEKEIRLLKVLAGNTKSCGCLMVNLYSARLKHGASKTPEYHTWKGMRARCNNPASPAFDYYGGRGIRICDRWNDFEAFLADMGKRPTPKHSLDRIDSNGNYEPGNCRWADLITQKRNRRNVYSLTLQGKTRSAAEWADVLGVTRGAVLARLRSGMSTEEALTKPFRPRRTSPPSRASR